MTFEEWSKPFYWTAVHDDPTVTALSGWYQWTPDGLVYLGATILDGDALSRPVPGQEEK